MSGFECHKALPQHQAVFNASCNVLLMVLNMLSCILDDAIAFDASPKTHVRTLREFLSRLRTHDLKLSPSKARLGATELDFLGHSISPAGLHPDTTNKVRAMTDMHMPTNLLSHARCWVVSLTTANFCPTCPSGSDRSQIF